MTRATLLLAAALAAVPVAAQSIFEMDPKKIEQGWHREKLEEIRSRDPKERAAAAKWLGGRKEPESIAALTTALKDPEASVRMEAASGLWSSEKAAEPARAALVAALDDPDPNVVTYAAGALQSIGMKEAELAEARRRALAHPDGRPHSRYLLARNLVGHEDPLVLLPHLLGYLERAAADRSHSGSNNREAAQRSLMRLVERAKDPRLVEPLREAARTMKSATPILVKVVAKVQPRPDDHLEFTLSFLEAREPAARLAAMDVLRDAKAEAEIARWAPRVVPLLGDADEDVRSRAASTLGNAAGLAAAHADALAAALADTSPRVRRSAAEALGYVGEGRQAMPAADRARVLASRPTLLRLAESDLDTDVRRAASGALERMAAGEAALATVAPVAPPSGEAEARGMAVLRAKKISFEPDMFQRALYSTDVEAVRAFLDAGMSAKAPFPGGRTPLAVVLFGGQTCSPGTRPTRANTVAVVKALIERGADPNIADDHGNTPLMFAASSGCDRELMKALLKAGAKTEPKNSAGLTAFEFGLMYAHDGLEEILAAGYRLPPARAKELAEAYAGKPAQQAMIRKAAARPAR